MTDEILEKLKLADFFRFSTSGFVAVVSIYFVFPDSLKDVNTTFGSVGMLLGIFVVSCIFYHIYRATIYPLILVFKDWTLGTKMNYRKIILSKYQLKTHDAEAVYVWLRQQDLIKLGTDRNNHAAAIHMLYQAFFVTTLLLIFYLIHGPVQMTIAITLAMISAALLFSGIRENHVLESTETKAFLAVPEGDVLKAVEHQKIISNV